MKDDPLEERLRSLIPKFSEKIPRRDTTLSKSKLSIKKGIKYSFGIAAISAYLYFTGPYIAGGFYDTLGRVYAHFGKHEKAIVYYTKSIEWEPEYYLPLLKDEIPYSYYNRGIAYADLGKYEEAIRDYTKAIAKAMELNPKKLDKRYAEAYINRGIAYARSKKYNEAIRDYTKAIEINQEYTLAYYNRAIAYWNLDNRYKASDDFNNYLRINKNKDGDSEKVRKYIRDLGYKPKY